ncbi:MAG: DUF362 domain-containing protein [Syntrophobacteraceae bacterium]|nr:DUF362 domain-containing protein [Syntrophobacteraceae bacterium]
MKKMGKERPGQPGMDRRDFLIRLAKAGATVGVAAGVGYFLHDPFGPRASAEKPPGVLPDFIVPGVGKKIAIATGGGRIKAIDGAIEALGGMGSFIKKGDRVLMKVNCAFASPPSLCATTSPELVAEVTRLCFRAGAASVAVTDNPINDPESCFSLSGIGEAARSSGAELILPRESLFTEFTAPGSSLIRDWPVFTGAFTGVTKLIGICPVKDHHRSGASMAMKNWYGFIGGRRNIFHQNIHTFIKDLALMIKPTLVILDGTFTMVSNGPTGGSLSDLKKTETMIASTDQVAADSAGARLLGKTAKDLPFIMQAERAGVGTADFESLKPYRVSIG